ncbi:MAG: hypothetical protein A2X64_11430 [Ignavibacteria bacterium GWF2_33_9]|nr:MAG: hypothetical protein A2X64_11430 [Ignavibacteria bacterium GWF2_33_9]
MCYWFINNTILATSKYKLKIISKTDSHNYIISENYFSIYEENINQTFKKSVDESSFVSPNLSLYPNPATSTITLTGVSEGVSECEIYDVLGEKVMTIETRSNVSLQQIDVSALPPGVYFVKVGDLGQKFVKM